MEAKKFEEFDVTFQNEIVIIKDGKEIPLRNNILAGRTARVVGQTMDGKEYLAHLYNPRNGELQQSQIRITK